MDLTAYFNTIKQKISVLIQSENYNSEILANVWISVVLGPVFSEFLHDMDKLRQHEAIEDNRHQNDENVSVLVVTIRGG